MAVERMHFWKDRALAARFKAGDVPQKERFRYLFAILLLLNVSDIVVYYNPVSLQPLDYITLAMEILSVLIFIGGSWICFKTNQRGDDKEFVSRYVSLSFPIGVQVLAFTLIIHEPFSLILPNTTQVDEIAGRLLDLYFYYRLNTALRIAAQ